ncbi:NUDIX domain-containing protein [Candidatus Parcubacteria bacterium]|nr:NUDIX domain-containing protein [Patescibacteria group bacterium]MBU4466889.1 NUDIX domain-containing protein [Patescibacteria group bacterium]MCG2688093.1 NUDIX domain-containing protein [Candidatus Parcubacteria bacterium]
MPERNVAIVIFYDDKENIIFQERGSASKVGEKYGFWGGQIESGETPEQAIKRELMEELGFVPEKLDFWRHISYPVIEGGKYHGWMINHDVFLSPITLGLEKIKTHEGEGMIKMTIDEAINSRGFSIGGTELLRKIKKELF